jgi:tRNA1(Val) A37 N6-methylase TrmN6
MKAQKLFLYQPTQGYRYNSDTIFLYDFIRRFRPKGALLDIGSGVGILGLLLKKDFRIDVTAIDKRCDMIAYTRRNFALHGWPVEAVCEDFGTWKCTKRFDMIVSNPPFYHPDVDQSDDSALNTARYAHHLPLVTLIKGAKSLLKPKGRFCFCYDAKQIDAVCRIAGEAKLNVETLRFVHAKIDRPSKLVFVSLRADSKAMTEILPPLVVFDEESRYLPEAQSAFEHANTHVVSADTD